MKAYFINAKDELIVEVDCKDYYHKKELINCSYIELYPYPINGNDMWTDEEANLRESNYLFQLDDIIVSGNAIIMSYDDEGDSADVKDLTIEDLKSRVKFKGKRAIDHSKLKFEVFAWE